MIDAESGRPRCVLLPSGPGQPARPMAAARPLFSTWPLLAPHFRGVLLPPQNRPDESVQWSWNEPAGAAPPSAAELGALRQRLAISQQVFDEACHGESDTSARAATVEAVRHRMSEITRVLAALPDPALAGYAARTDRGLFLHSWGLARPLTPRAPGSGFEVAGQVIVAGRPAPGYEVRLETADGDSLARTTSADDGRFVFPQAKPGSLRVRAVSRPPAVRFSEHGLAVELVNEAVTDLELRDETSRTPVSSRHHPVRPRTGRWVAAGAALAVLLTILILRRGDVAAAATDGAARTAWDANIAPRETAEKREPADEPPAVRPPPRPVPGQRAPGGTPGPNTQREPSATPDSSGAQREATAATAGNASGAMDATASHHPAEPEAPASPGVPPLAPPVDALSAGGGPSGTTAAAAGAAPAEKNDDRIEAAGPTTGASTAPPRDTPATTHDQPATADRSSAATPTGGPATVTDTPATSAGRAPGDAPADEPLPAGTGHADRAALAPGSVLPAPVWTLQMTVSFSPWRQELLRDAIVPTLPVRNAETDRDTKTLLLTEHLPGPEAPLRPTQIVTGLRLERRGPGGAGTWRWETASGTPPARIVAGDAHSELSWRGPLPNGRYTLVAADGRVLARVECTAPGHVQVWTAAPLAVWPWLEFEAAPEGATRFGWRLLGSGQRPAGWRQQRNPERPERPRLELRILESALKTQVQALALMDDVSGWGLVSDVEQKAHANKSESSGY